MKLWRKGRESLAAMVAASLVATGLVGPAHGQSAVDLRARVQAMENELKELKRRLDVTEKTAEVARKEATAEDTRNINWHLGGYGTADYTGTNESGESSSFGEAKFNPIFLVGYKDLLLFESELEIAANTDGGTDTALEFANLNIMATDWLTITAGKFLSPLGDFQQHSHPSWINKLPDRPAGFMEDGGTEHLSEIGAMVRGAFPVGSTTIDYAAFVGNGPRLADDANDGVTLEGFGGDVNEDKAFGGRLGIRPIPQLKAGISGMLTKIKGNQGAGGLVTSGDYDMIVGDAAYRNGNLDVRGEYIRAHLDSLSTALDPTQMTQVIPASTWQAWYLQAAYRLAGISDNPIVKNVEPVIRFSQFDVNGLSNFKTNEEDRWTVGLDYWFAPSIVVKLAYEAEDFHNKEDVDLFRAQAAFGF